MNTSYTQLRIVHSKWKDTTDTQMKMNTIYTQSMNKHKTHSLEWTQNTQSQWINSTDTKSMNEHNIHMPLGYPTNMSMKNSAAKSWLFPPLVTRIIGDAILFFWILCAICKTPFWEKTEGGREKLKWQWPLFRDFLS